MSDRAQDLDEQRGTPAVPYTPPRSAAIKYGLGGLVLIIGVTLIEIGLHGLNVESWGAVSSSALILVPAWSGFLLLRRYRVDRRREWFLLAIGAFGWATLHASRCFVNWPC